MDVFDLAAKITLDSSGFEKSLSAVGGSLKALAGVSTAAMGSAVAGVTALAKQSIDSYASYEQLVGGVDTLFKDSTLKVQQYAENAYKTAGLSANEYMETVTSFSASLLQSLEGDTERAADVADVAIRDMSDNANKMGTAMESIQNAYQGFAKQNYTMLDNLKLGYGGTKAEMERLLADANELNEKQGVYTDYQIENYADIVEAIHVVQSEMGITGTTASEAAATIEGSMSSLKASWSNLLTELGKGGDVNKALENSGVEWEKYADKAWAASGAVEGVADEIQYNLERINKGEGSLEELQEYLQLEYDMDSSDAVAAIEAVRNTMSNSQGIIDNFVQSLEAAADNVIPRVVTVLGGIGTAIEHIAPIIAEEVPKLVQEVLPSLLTAAAELVNSFAEAIRSALPTLVNAIVDALPDVIGAIENLIGSLLPAISDAVAIIADGLPDLIGILGGAIADLAPMLINTIGDVIGTVVDGLVETAPVLLDSLTGIIVNVASALTETLPVVIPKIFELIYGILDAITSSDLFSEVSMVILPLLSAIVDGLMTAAPTVYEALPQIIDNLFSALQKHVDEHGEEWAEQVIDFIATLAEDVKELIPQLLEATAAIVMALVDGVSEYVPVFIDTVKSFFGIESFSELGDNVINGIVNKIAEGVEKAKTAARNLVEGVMEWLSTLPERAGYALMNTLANIIKWAIEAPARMREAARTMLENIVEFVSKIPERVGYFVTEVIPKVVEWGANLRDKGRQAASDFFDVVVNKIKELPGKMLDVGYNIVTGLWDGISSAKDWLARQIGSFSSGVVSGFKDAFEISSPSKVMRDSVGKFLADGIGVGFVDEMDSVIDDMTEAVSIDPFRNTGYNVPVAQDMLGAFSTSDMPSTPANTLNAPSTPANAIYVTINNNWDGTRIDSELDMAEIIENMTDRAVTAMSERLEQLRIFDTRAYGGVVIP